MQGNNDSLSVPWERSLGNDRYKGTMQRDGQTIYDRNSINKCEVVIGVLNQSIKAMSRQTSIVCLSLGTLVPWDTFGRLAAIPGLPRLNVELQSWGI